MALHPYNILSFSFAFYEIRVFAWTFNAISLIQMEVGSKLVIISAIVQEENDKILQRCWWWSIGLYPDVCVCIYFFYVNLDFNVFFLSIFISFSPFF